MQAPIGNSTVVQTLTRVYPSLRNSDLGLTTTGKVSTNAYKTVRPKIRTDLQAQTKDELGTYKALDTYLTYYDPNTNYTGMTVYNSAEITAIDQPKREVLVAKGMIEGIQMGLASRQQAIEFYQKEAAELDDIRVKQLKEIQTTQELLDEQRVYNAKQEAVIKESDTLRRMTEAALDEARANAKRPTHYYDQRQEGAAEAVLRLTTGAGSTDLGGKIGLGLAGLTLLLPFVLAFFKSH